MENQIMEIRLDFAVVDYVITSILPNDTNATDAAGKIVSDL